MSAFGLAQLAQSAANAADTDAAILFAITDNAGQPVPEVVVHAKRLDGAAAAGPSAPLATMNQHDLAFAPHVVVVEAGAGIEFPNQDDVLHHVYSFSAPYRFAMTVDAGENSDPVLFDTPGIVTLGCNIHDDMLGYVVIVDTPYFAISGAEGQVELNGLEAGRYEVEIWTPRLPAKHLPEPRIVELEAGNTIAIQHQFEKRLYPAHQHSGTSLHWSHY